MNYKKGIMWRYRYFITTLSVFLFLFFYGMSAFAYFVPGSNGASETDNIISYYSVDVNRTPYLARDQTYAYLTSQGIDTSSGNMNIARSFGAYGVVNDFQSVYTDKYKFVKQCTWDNNTLISSMPYDSVFTYGTISGYKYYCSITFEGTGRKALVNDCDDNWWVVSDENFKVLGGNWNNSDNRFVYEVDSATVNGVSSYNGYYWYRMVDYYKAPVFTNLPIYIGTLDKSTGFDRRATFDMDTAMNCNYLFINGVAVDPNIPVVDPDDVIQPYSSDGIHYVFGTVEPQFISDGVKDDSILAKFEMHMNDYMLNHPSEYDFVYEYQMKVVSTSGDYVFKTDGSANIADILAGGGKDQTYWVNTPFTYFETNDNLSLNSFLQTVFTGLGSPLSQYTDGAVVSYGVGNPSNTRTFGKFTLGVRQNYLNTIQSMKFYYKCYYVWNGEPVTTSGKLAGYKDLLSGNNNTTQNDISNNYNPPSENLNNNYPSTNGAGYNNGTGSFYDGDVTVINQDSNVPWTPYTLDQVSYGNVKDMFEDIKDFIDSTSSNSFWQVLDRTFSYIPDKIWQYITITIAVICGFAVVRYVLRR